MLLNNGTHVSDIPNEDDSVTKRTRKLILNPKTATYDNLDPTSRELVLKTISFLKKRKRTITR